MAVTQAPWIMRLLALLAMVSVATSTQLMTSTRGHRGVHQLNASRTQVSYLLVEVAQLPGDARSGCPAGYELAMPKSPAENAGVAAVITGSSTALVWAGAQVTNGAWMWDDGSSVASYTNWAPGQGAPVDSSQPWLCLWTVPNHWSGWAVGAWGDCHGNNENFNIVCQTTTGGAAAVGDPHLQNVHGERFDLMKAGQHVLINIPRGKDAEHAFLRVQADARQLGGNCADMYFQEVNVTGSWAEAQNSGGYRYSVSQNGVGAPSWVAFGQVELKVVHGRTDSGLTYLNVYVKHLLRAGYAIGGLLGEDDHEDVITPPEACVKRMTLWGSSSSDSKGGRRSVSSIAVASE